MRWVVYSLLAVNLGLLGWNLHTHGASRAAPPTGGTAPVAPPDRGELPLLSELADDALRQRPPAASAEADSPANPSPDEAPDPSSPPTAPGSTVSDTAATDTPSPAAPTAGPPLTVARAPAAPTPPAPLRACLTLGPLDASADVAALEAWLEARGADVDVRTDERREVALYWVFFPPRATRAEAIAEVEAMKTQGIDDIIVVPRGDMANAISLGVFSRTETRDRRLKELDDKGYQPSIGPRYRSKLATWVDVTAQAGALPEEALRERWPDVQAAAKPCPPPGERGFHFSGPPKKP